MGEGERRSDREEQIEHTPLRFEGFGRGRLSRSARFEQDAADDEASRVRLRAAGVTFHPTFSEAEQQAIRTAALTTWDTLMKEAGGQGPAWRARIQSALSGN